MEFEVLDEKVEWEVRRVAAAFGIEEWGLKKRYGLPAVFEGFIGPLKLHWRVQLAEWSDLRLYTPVKFGYQGICWVTNPRTQASNAQNRNVPIPPTGQTRELIARGLYLLEIEDEGVLFRIDHPLTVHEKLELRFSLPREFWPQKWLDEEGR